MTIPPEQPQPQGWQPPPGYYGHNPAAPYGVDPLTGIPFSDKQKVVAGILNIIIAGVGRMYAGHVGLGIAQLLVAILTCGLGALWSLIDGILLLVNGGRDGYGRPLRD